MELESVHSQNSLGSFGKPFHKNLECLWDLYPLELERKFKTTERSKPSREGLKRKRERWILFTVIYDSLTTKTPAWEHLQLNKALHRCCRGLLLLVKMGIAGSPAQNWSFTCNSAHSQSQSDFPPWIPWTSSARLGTAHEGLTGLLTGGKGEPERGYHSLSRISQSCTHDSLNRFSYVSYTHLQPSDIARNGLILQSLSVKAAEPPVLGFIQRSS